MRAESTILNFLTVPGADDVARAREFARGMARERIVRAWNDLWDQRGERADDPAWQRDLRAATAVRAVAEITSADACDWNALSDAEWMQAVQACWPQVVAWVASLWDDAPEGTDVPWEAWSWAWPAENAGTVRELA